MPRTEYKNLFHLELNVNSATCIVTKASCVSNATSWRLTAAYKQMSAMQLQRINMHYICSVLYVCMIPFRLNAAY
jgi:hypothetical protein